MKKLSKFLSLALTSASLLLPSASALRDISGSDAEKFMDPKFASSYAKEARMDYESLTVDKKTDELKLLKLKIASVLETLKEKNPKLAVCLTVQLMRFFGTAHPVVFAREIDGLYDPDTYDEECAILSAPSVSFDDLPIVVQLFKGHYLSSSLRIN